MTEEQFEDIKSRLDKWREERGLSVEDQKKNFKINYTKELVEFFEAERDGNEYEMIDALCDMVIVSINAGFEICEPESYRRQEPRDGDLVSIFTDEDLDFLLSNIGARGYDPYNCLLETIKELETRTGAWNEAEGKWCKDVGAYSVEEAQRKIYEMDNGVCEVMWAVLEEENETHFVFEVDFGTNIQKVKIKKWYRAEYEKCKAKE